MKIAFEELIIGLLNQKEAVNIQEILNSMNQNLESPPHRRTIQRVLAELIAKEVITTTGKGPARFYMLVKENKKIAMGQPFSTTFKEVFLSEDSQQLFQYLSKPLHLRAPTSYKQDFLRSYLPNKTFYLNKDQRRELFLGGQSEKQIYPAGTYARNILNRLLIDLSWNSSRLEGNTYSLLETMRLIEFGESPQGKDIAETQMIINHKNAIEYLIEIADENIMTSHQICSIHALLADNLLGDPSATGKIRERSVGITGSAYIPLGNAHILKECFDIIVNKINEIADPFEQSFFAMVHLSYLQAFEDVNKRTARLVANIPFIKNNLKPLSFVDVNQQAYISALLGIYEKNDISLFKDLYIWAYQRSAQRYTAVQQVTGEPNYLKLKYQEIIQSIIRTIILKKVKGQQIVVTIQRMLKELNLKEKEEEQKLFQLLETEVLSLHDGNIARFKIRPSEFQEWKRLQSG